MKSLEMAKKTKEFLKAYRIKLITEINQDEKVYGFNNIGAKDELKEVIDVLCWYDKLEKDLEVLEILKKYLYIVENQIPRTDDYFEILESDLDEMQDDENCDDFHKIKQWLEDNENDR